MEKIRIITDSTSEILSPYPQNLTVLPLTIHFGQEEYLDGVTIDHQTFYKKLMDSSALPSTSLVPPAVFEDAFDQAEAAGETVIALIISSKLSGTYQSAKLAADGRDHVYVIDSLNATLGLQILVRHALHLVEQGLSAKEIVEKITALLPRARLMGAPETLEYLRRGGRISNAIAIVGGALGIKPILALEDGVIGMVGKARGFKNVAVSIQKEVEKRKGIDFSLPFFVGYTGLTDENMQRFIQDTKDLWQGAPTPLPTASVGATIGTHVGPNAVVIAYFENV